MFKKTKELIRISKNRIDDLYYKYGLLDKKIEELEMRITHCANGDHFYGKPYKNPLHTDNIYYQRCDNCKEVVTLSNKLK